MKRLDLPAPHGSLRLVSSVRAPLPPAEPAEWQHWELPRKALVVSGWIAALAGVLVYCLASFASGADADLPDVVLRGAIPYARAGLLLIGCGTLTWVIGCVVERALRDDGRCGR